MVTASMKLRHMLFGSKALTKLDSIFKSRDIALPTKVHLVNFRVARLCAGGVSPAGVPCLDGPAGRGAFIAFPTLPEAGTQAQTPRSARVLRGRGGVGPDLFPLCPSPSLAASRAL